MLRSGSGTVCHILVRSLTTRSCAAFSRSADDISQTLLELHCHCHYCHLSLWAHDNQIILAKRASRILTQALSITDIIVSLTLHILIGSAVRRWHIQKKPFGGEVISVSSVGGQQNRAILLDLVVSPLQNR